MSAILQSNSLFAVRRFKARTAAEREAQWLAHRSQGIGGSDMGTIMGLNKYSSPYELWLEKTGRVDPKDISGHWPIIRGNLLENELRRWYRRNHRDLKVVSGTDVSLTSREHPHMIASLDGVIAGDSRGIGVLECKTASAYRSNDWHDDDGNLIAPPYYMAQVTHYLAVTGFSWGVFVADIGESSPVEVEFTRDEDDIAAVVKAAETFWGFVERDEPPQLTGSDVERLYPQPEEGVEIADDDGFTQLASDYLDWGDAEREAKKHKSELGEQLKALIGNREGLVDDRYKATFKHYSRPAHLVKESSGRKLHVAAIKSKERN